jgi:hypothetical protein
MKKPTTQPLQRRTLVLCRETIAVLKPPQLGQVEGGLNVNLGFFSPLGGCSYPSGDCATVE